MNLHDFYFIGDNYRYRFEVDAKQCFIDLIREQFNSGVKYKGRVLKWDTIIEEKTAELGRYLIDRSMSLDFADPSLVLERTDDQVVREVILRMTQQDARRRGIGKSTFHHLRKNVKRACFRVYGKTRQRLELVTS